MRLSSTHFAICHKKSLGSTEKLFFLSGKNISKAIAILAFFCYNKRENL